MITLEKNVQTSEEIKTCGECGRGYSLRERTEQTKTLPKPNTAGDYCTDRCWVRGISAQEYA